MSIFFTSDTHFAHRNIITLCNRPFNSIEEHDAKLINNWNSIVNQNDTIYHLGDFALGHEEHILSIIKRLNGNKVLIQGNHDKHGERVKKCFMIIKDFLGIYIPYENKKLYIFLCHYPMMSWNRSCHGSLHLHGHVHGRLNEKTKDKRMLDVGVDSWNYIPVSLDDVIKKLNNRKYLDV
jgi:calcineurin-like phosphoesterase family protein